jgi:hypothetical protein
MSTAAEKKKAVKNLMEAVHDVSANYAMGMAPPYAINKLRKNADVLGVRAELDDFMRDSWQMTIRASKKKKKRQ